MERQDDVLVWAAGGGPYRVPRWDLGKHPVRLSQHTRSKQATLQ
jgi:hypothetical protein